MGLFDTNWIVEFEYSEGFFSSYKKATIEVQASSEYGAKDKAKAVLKPKYNYLKIIGVYKSDSKNNKRLFSTTTEANFFNEPLSCSSSISDTERRDLERERERLNRERAELEREKRELEEEKKRIGLDKQSLSLDNEENKIEGDNAGEEIIDTEIDDAVLEEELWGELADVPRNQPKNKNRKLSRSFYAMIALNVFVLANPIFYFCVMRYLEVKKLAEYDKAVEEGLRYTQELCEASLEQIRQSYVVGVMLLVFSLLFAFASLYLTYKNEKRRR